MKPKHILFLLGTYPSYGGVEMVTTVLANQFIEDGHCVTIASFSQPKNDFAELHLSRKCHLLSLSYPVLSLKNIKKLSAYVRDRNVNVLINQWVVPFMVTLVWKLALAGTGCKVYSVHHGKPDTNRYIQELEIKINAGKNYLKVLRYWVREVSRLCLAYCIRSSHQFIVLSPSFVPITKKYVRVAKDGKIISITNPITIDVPTEELPKEKEIIYVGRIEYNQKRTFRVIDIWKELEPKFPDWKLTVVGDGEDRTDLERRIEAYGLERVSVTGFVNPISYYQRASLLLLTSEYEGFGLVIVEAMKFGVVPIVYNSYDTAEDLITDGYNGILIDKPYNIGAFTNVLRKLMDDKELLNRISRNARKISDCFNVNKVANEWYQLFKD